MDRYGHTSYTYNSKKTRKNDIFICLSGEHVDGHEFAEEAINNGALVCVVESFMINRNKGFISFKKYLNFDHGQ